MFGIGFGEMLVIGIAALLVVGPEDLPKMFRAMGQAFGRLQSLGRDFKHMMDEAANETGVKDLQSDFQNLKNEARDPLGLKDFNELSKETVTDWEKWEAPKDEDIHAPQDKPVKPKSKAPANKPAVATKKPKPKASPAKQKKTNPKAKDDDSNT